MELQKYFELKQRDNSDEFVVFTDDCPQWVQDTVFEAHFNGKDLPNDWIYKTCYDIFGACENDELDSDESIDAFIDGYVDIYTNSLFKWGADLCNSYTYASAEEEALEFTDFNNGLSTALQAIQYCAIKNIVHVVLNCCDEHKEEEENEQDDDIEDII
jgi:hypothetical protein